ncbi:hypothetical protein PRIPAC_90786 [Pristionchus pacificus]|uniref:Uncharacterized protein n=1 Tax=Pristionchus pacificus TaxID=54126 RepID=A0A2A6CXN9_PRIPA|nr:hypothetical protein PRIPAC_90786 [Pristionchus pacificus]|eukprot:PDM82935.1 hypothetical protein PRIPAC_37328 [Pristionchus pacificus]
MKDCEDLFLMFVIVTAASWYAACAALPVKILHLRHSFKMFTGIFAFEAVTRSLPIINGGLLSSFGKDFIASEACPIMLTITAYLIAIRPYLYLCFILYSMETHCLLRIVIPCFTPAFLSVITVLFLFDGVSVYEAACKCETHDGFTMSKLIFVVGQALEYGNLLLSIMSLFRTALNETQSLHRKLLLVAVAVQIPSNGLFYFLPFFGEYFRHLVSLIFPIVYVLATNQHEKKDERKESISYTRLWYIHSISHTHNAISWNIGETVKMEAKEVETTPALKHMTNYECVHCEATERRGKGSRASGLVFFPCHSRNGWRKNPAPLVPDRTVDGVAHYADPFLFLLVVAEAIIYTSCAILTLNNLNLRTSFKNREHIAYVCSKLQIFAVIFTVEAIACTLPIVNGILFTMIGNDFTSSECEFFYCTSSTFPRLYLIQACPVMVGTTEYFKIIRPFLYSCFIFYTTEANCVVRMVPSSFLQFPSQSLFLYGEVLNLGNLMTLILSLFRSAVAMTEVRALHRNLLLVAVAVQIPSNVLFSFLPLFVEYMKHGKALIFPIFYVFATREYPKKNESTSLISYFRMA